MENCKNLAKAKVRGGSFLVKSVPVNTRSISTPLGYQTNVKPKVPKLSNK